MSLYFLIGLVIGIAVGILSMAIVSGPCKNTY